MKMVNVFFIFTYERIYPIYQARSHAEATCMKPELEHKFYNLTLFSPQICSDDIKWAGAQHFLQDQMSTKQ